MGHIRQLPTFLKIASGIVLLGWLAIGAITLSAVYEILMRQITTVGQIVSLFDIEWRLVVWLRYTSVMLVLIFLGMTGNKLLKRLQAWWARVATPPSAGALRARRNLFRVWILVQFPLGLFVGVFGLIFLIALITYGSRNLRDFSAVDFIPALAILLLILILRQE